MSSPHRRASKILARRCQTIGNLVRCFGPCEPVRRRGSAFVALSRAICFQQLAGAAASTIWGRAQRAVGERWTPQAVLETDEDDLRGAGLSAAKLASMRDLAAKSLDGTVALRGLHRRPDDEVIERLVQVRGIGEWTAQMFLMFHLHRLDVWPVGDLGVRHGYARAFRLREPPTAKQLGPLGEAYRPYRSVAAWYMWRVMDGP